MAWLHPPGVCGDYNPPKEITRRFRFSIRELLLVTVIVALCVTWWIDRSRVAKDRDVQKGKYDGIVRALWKFHGVKVEEGKDGKIVLRSEPEF